MHFSHFIHWNNPVKFNLFYVLVCIGTFVNAQNFEATFLNSSPVTLTAFTSGDIDNDGDIDLLYGARKDRRIAWLENNGQGEFINQHNISNTIGIPQRILFEDLDADGWKDIICSDYYGIHGGVVWKKNNGNGHFSDWMPINEGFTYPSEVEVADIDNDNDLDVVMNSEFTDSLVVVKNNGNGTFASPVTVSDDESFTELLLADADGDTDIDIIFSTSDDKIAYFENSSGTFSSTLTSIAIGVGGVRQLQAEDINGDGDDDLVFGYAHSGSITGIRWLENTGPGVYGTEHTLVTNYLRTDALFIDDIDGDGDLDMYSGSDQSSGLRFHENDGSGTFTTYNIGRLDDPIAIVGIDLNNSGFLDPIYAQPKDNTIGYFEHVSNEDWKSKNPITPLYVRPVDVCISDLDADNDMDIACISKRGVFGSGTSPDRAVLGSMRIHENTTLNQYDIVQYTELNGLSEINEAKDTQIRDVDMDNDADIDFIGYHKNSGLLYIMENYGSSSSAFVRRDIEKTNARVIGAVGLDIDSDGDRDLITVQMDSTIGIYTNLGNMTFSNRSILTTINFEPTSHHLPNLHIADINNDGIEDLIVEIPDDVLTSNISTELLFFENNGSSALTLSSNTLTVQTTIEELFFEHIDSDNLIDIVMKKGYGPTVDHVTLYTNQGSFQFSSATTLFTSNVNIDIKDMDGDNDPDIVLAYQAVSWFENDGNGNFSTNYPIGSFPIGVYNIEVVAADLDNDGDEDVIYFGTNQEFKIFENNSGTFQSVNTFTYQCSMRHLKVQDLTGDNVFDIIGYDGREHLFWQKGYGFDFSKAITLSGASSCANDPREIIEMDVDENGEQDYLIASEHGILWSKRLNDSTFTIPTLLIDSTDHVTSIKVTDINGDGVSDIVSAFDHDDMRNIEIYQNNGSGNFGVSQDIFSENFYLDKIRLTDIDGDSDMDIIGFLEDQYDTTPRVVLYTNDGAGVFDTNYIVRDNIYVYDVITNDMNNDGSLDLVIASDDLLMNTQQTGGDFDTTTTLSTNRYFSLATGDVDNDTNEDLVASNGYAFNWYNYNAGNYDVNAIFMPYYIYPDVCKIYTSDLDGDNDLDIVTVLEEEHNVVIHTNLQNTISYLSETTCDSILSPSGGLYYTESGTYYDTLSTAQGGDSIIVTDLTVFGNDSVYQEFEICEGESITVGQSMYTLSGEYTDTLENTCGNDSILYTTLVVYNSDTTELTQTICDGDTIQFGGGDVFAAGEYMNTVPNAMGCDSVVILTVEVTEIGVNIQADNNTTLSVTNPIVGATYQWVDCDNSNAPIAGANSSSYTFTENGNYAVEMTLDGCTETSLCMSIEGIGVKEYNLLDVSVTPNPTAGELNLTFGKIHIHVHIRLWNLLGHVVYEQTFLNTEKEVLDINHLPSGIYTIEIHSDHERVVKKIIKEEL